MVESQDEMVRSGHIHFNRIAQWLGWADKDYMAARRLLLDAYLAQGAAFANTALEKYFKTVLLFTGKKIPRSHDVGILRNALLPYIPRFNVIDENFLQVLGKAYRLRYPDDLEVGFSISLTQPKLITELDRIVYEIRKGFRLSRSSQERIKIGIDRLVERSDPKLMDCNCYFGMAERSKIFESYSQIIHAALL